MQIRSQVSAYARTLPTVRPGQARQAYQAYVEKRQPSSTGAPVAPQFFSVPDGFIEFFLAMSPTLVHPATSGAGALVGGLLKGRTGGAVGAVVGSAIAGLPVAWMFLTEKDGATLKSRLGHAALALLPTLATAAGAGIGFAVGGPLGALVGSMVPMLPHFLVLGGFAIKEGIGSALMAAGGALLLGGIVIGEAMNDFVGDIFDFVTSPFRKKPVPDPAPPTEPTPAPAAPSLNLVG